jgi:ribonuclease HI/probable phosphoglycerate mutase
MEKLVVFCDGASKGNPGPSAIGVVISDPKKGILKEYGQNLGKTTNNVAEYQAVIFALKKIKALFGKKKAKEMEIEIRSDSQLLVSQLNGKYKILNPNIQPLFLKIWNLKIDFGKVKFVLIPREANKLADALAQKAIS